MGRQRRTKTSRVVLTYEVDESSLNRAKQSADELESRLTQVTSGERRLGSAADEAGRRVGGLSDAMSKARREADRTAADLAEAESRVERYGRAWRQASNEVESFGDVSTSFSAVSGLASGLGAGGLGEVGMVGADIFDAVEGLRRLPIALRGTGEAAQEAIQGLTGAEVGLGTLGGVAVGIGAVFAGAAIVISEWMRRQEEAAELTRDYTQRVQELNEALAAGATTEDIQEMRREAEASFEAAQADLDTLYEDLRTGLENATSGIPILSEGYAGRTREQLLSAARVVGVVDGNVRALSERIEEANRAVLDAALRQSEYGTALVEGVAATNDAIAAARENAELQLEISELIATGSAEQLQATIDSNNRRIEALESERAAIEEIGEDTAPVRARLAELDEELNNLRTTNEQLIPVIERLTAAEAARAETAKAALEAEEAKAAVDRSLVEARERTASVEEDILALEEQFSSRRIQLKEATEDRIDALEKSFDSFLEKASDRIADVQVKAEKERQDLEREFMRDSLKATQAFLRQEKEIDEEAARERIRRLEDLNEDLLSAEESNDVVAFIQAQRRGERDLRRMAESESVEAKQRQEQFDLEAEERREERKQRLQEIRDSAQERIAEIRKEVDEQRALLRERIQEQRDALRQELFDLASALQAEVDLRKGALNAELQVLQQGYAAQVDAARQTADAMRTIASTSVRNIGSKVATAASRPGAVPSSFSPYDVLRREALAQAANRSVTFNTTIGDIGADISRKEVESAISTGLSGLANSVLKGMRTGKGV